MNEAEMSAVVVVHQNIEHIVVSTTSGAGADLGSSSDVSCCGGPTSEFCMQHRVQQSLKKMKYTLRKAKYDSPRRKKEFILYFLWSGPRGLPQQLICSSRKCGNKRRGKRRWMMPRLTTSILWLKVSCRGGPLFIREYAPLCHLWLFASKS